MCVDYRQWACFSRLHTVFYTSSSWEAIQRLAGVQIWRGRNVSYVEVWPLEVNVHAWNHSTQCNMDTMMHIGFTLGNSITELVWIRIQCGQAYNLENISLKQKTTYKITVTAPYWRMLETSRPFNTMFRSCARIIPINRTPKCTWPTMVTMATVHKHCKLCLGIHMLNNYWTKTEISNNYYWVD